MAKNFQFKCPTIKYLLNCNNPENWILWMQLKNISWHGIFMVLSEGNKFKLCVENKLILLGKKKYLHNTYMGIISSINISERFWYQWRPQGLREWTCLVSSHWISPAPYFHKACSTTCTPAPMVRDIRQSRYVGQREGQGLQVTGRVTRSGLGNGDLRESKCRHRILKRMSNWIACRVGAQASVGNLKRQGDLSWHPGFTEECTGCFRHAKRSGESEVAPSKAGCLMSWWEFREADGAEGGVMKQRGA